MLNKRQSALYVYQVSIWRKGARTGIGDFTPYAMVASNVACLYSSAPTLDLASDAGRTIEERLPLMHWFSFDVVVSIQSGDRLLIAAAPNGSADVGRWFAVHGDPHVNAWRANRQQVFVLPTAPVTT